MFLVSQKKIDFLLEKKITLHLVNYLSSSLSKKKMSELDIFNHKGGESSDKSNLVTIDLILEKIKDCQKALSNFQSSNLYLDTKKYEDVLNQIYSLGLDICFFINFHKDILGDVSKATNFSNIWHGINHDYFPGEVNCELLSIPQRFLREIYQEMMGCLTSVSKINSEDPKMAELLIHMGVSNYQEIYDKQQLTIRKQNCDLLSRYLWGYFMQISNNKQELDTFECKIPGIGNYNPSKISSNMYF